MEDLREAVFAAVTEPEKTDVRAVADSLVDRFGDATIPELSKFLQVSELNIREVLSA